jgi:hypothetical protein
LLEIAVGETFSDAGDNQDEIGFGFVAATMRGEKPALSMFGRGGRYRHNAAPSSLLDTSEMASAAAGVHPFPALSYSLLTD